MTAPAIERLICQSIDLQNGGAGVRFELPWHGEVTPAFVIRYNDKVHAYLNRCAHVPVQLDWQPGEFFDHSQLYLICATHGALYAPESGRCMGGRCNGKGLHALSVTERDGSVYLITQVK
ncbi:MAG TPA: Rieske 2Fe-2S domain-containing protein [Rhodocyclaceae bacterium]|jgi:nitrite reductase/ring-hydroxylating ferredoxin subunit|nr:Rieske 2Fe-2S domain-containing protein [Rhodocyclaceae bacterium]